MCFISIVVLLCLTSCASIVGLFNTPTYSLHSTEKITLEQSKSNINSHYNKVYIKTGSFDNYLIQSRVVADVRGKLEKRGVNITDNINEANFILSVNIRNVVVDLDSKYTETLRKAFVFQDTAPSFSFDGSNNPHVLLNKVEKIEYQEKGLYGLKGRNMAPAILFPLVGAGVGFTAGYFIGASISPIGIGLAGAFVVGGATYILYSSLKTEGIIVIYDVVVDEKVGKNFSHNKKVLTKTSGNSTDEVYYNYYNNWMTHISKNAVIALGSKALRKKMIGELCPIIVDNVVSIFE